jgi:hypothetical protein
VALHGSLETLALDEVLSLLSNTAKTGELRINADRLTGRLWFSDGQLVGAEAGRARSLVDAVFELLRLETGTFSFDQDRKAPVPSTPSPVGLVVGEAKDRLIEWREIEQIVPALACRVSLTGVLSQASVTITSDQWKLLVVFGPGGTVEDLVQNLGLSEFEACRAVRDLATVGLVEVGPDPSAPVFDERKDRDDLSHLTEGAEVLDDVIEPAHYSEVDEASDQFEGTAMLGRIYGFVNDDDDDDDDDEVSAAAIADDNDHGVAGGATGEADLDERVAKMESPKGVARFASHDERANAAQTPDAAEFSEFEDAPELDDSVDEDEVNRGVLLKFLSTVHE